jgi:energy-coupling factor transporter ATP-binding protein EcfA2
MHYTRHDESPNQFHRWTAYTILAAAVNRNIWMDRGYYKLFPNLYVLFIGPSGVGKSSSSGIGIELLRETTLKVNIYKDFITPPALVEFMSRSSVSTEFQFGGKTVLTQKTPLLLYASELGNLLSIRSGIRELTLLLTELFNKQGDHEDTTNKRGTIKIKKPNVTFLGCCFPEWIEEELVSISLRSGFLGRMLVVVGNIKRHRASKINLTPEDLLLKKDLIHDLEIIGALYGELQWSPEAQAAWEAWYNDQPIDMSVDGMEIAGFGSRKAQFIQRLAIINAIGRSNNLLVTEDDLRTGIKMVRYCEGNIRNMGAVSEDYKEVQKIKKNLTVFCKKVPMATIDLGVLMKRTSQWVKKKRLEEVLEQLALEGFIDIRGRKIVILGPFED